MMLLSLALAADVVDAGAVLEVKGPAVVLDERAYRDYVRDSRRLAVCGESLDDALDALDASRKRTARAVEIARAQMDADEDAAAVQAEAVEQLTEALEKSERRRSRLVGQRSVLLGVVAGVVAGASVTVLAR